MANPSVPYVQTSEAVVGEGHPLLPDVVNRPLKQVLAWSGIDASTGFTGLARVFSPKAFGAVGDGITDDAVAIQQCLDAARASVTTTWQIPKVDFGGLSYRVGTQLEVPGGNGMILENGRLLASATFDTSKYLLATGRLSDAALADGQKLNNLTVRDVYFDSNHRGGGLLLQRANRVRVESCTFVHYSTQGLRTAVDGHEMSVSKCQFAEYLWGEPLAGGNAQDHADLYVGTGIRFETNDNYIVDCVIQLSRYGIYLANSDANLIRGAHIWPGYVKTGTAGAGATLSWINTCLYIDQNSQLNQITNCYFDGGQVIWENPWKASITNSIFLHGWGDPNKGMIVFKPMIVGEFIDGVQITGNVFQVNGGGSMLGLFIDTSAGTFNGGNISRCRWADNAFTSVAKFYSEANVTLAQTGAQDWAFDFYLSGTGLFPFNIIKQFRFGTWQSAGGTSHFRVSALSNGQATVSSYSDAAIGTKQNTTATVYAWASINNSD